jgi:DnaJ-class molecular chaperone
MTHYYRDDRPVPPGCLPSRAPRRGKPVKVCPSCDGEGLITVMNDAAQPWRQREIDIECPECDGAGAVEIEEGEQ